MRKQFQHTKRGPRICVCIKGAPRSVPVADKWPIEFLTEPPQKIGDEALIRTEGQTVQVMLLPSSGHVRDRTYLVEAVRA